MKLNANQLGKQLQGTLAAVYAVSGDEPLLCQEASDAIRGAARAQGFDEREVFDVDASFDWGRLYEAGASLSLFAQKRILELRLPTGKPGDKGSAALLDYLARPAEDTLLLISLPRLDAAAQKTKWAKALLEHEQAQFVQIWPVELALLPQWINQRLARLGLAGTPEAVELIAERVEGNLLAAAQEIEKLRLLTEGSQVDADTVRASVADSARYDVFGLLDAALAGDAAHALRILDGLRGEGVEAPVVLWALARELRLLANLAQLQESGTPLERAFTQVKPPVWDKRRPLLTRALQRHGARRLEALLRDAQVADEQIKGQAPGEVWLTLASLALVLAGKRLALGKPLS